MKKLITTWIVALTLVACGQQQSAKEYIESGLVFQATQEWSGATIEFKNAVKIEPENARARALLGKAYFETSEFAGAIKELVKQGKALKQSGGAPDWTGKGKS